MAITKTDFMRGMQFRKMLGKPKLLFFFFMYGKMK